MAKQKILPPKGERIDELHAKIQVGIVHPTYNPFPSQPHRTAIKGLY